MIETYAQMVADSTPGRFEGEGPMTAYLWELIMQGGECDHAGDTDTGWADLCGRWIVWGTTTGFVTAERYASRADAREAFDAYAAQVEYADID